METSESQWLYTKIEDIVLHQNSSLINHVKNCKVFCKVFDMCNKLENTVYLYTSVRDLAYNVTPGFFSGSWKPTQKQPSRSVLKKEVLKIYSKLQICSKFTGEHPWWIV